MARDGIPLGCPARSGAAERTDRCAQARDHARRSADRLIQKQKEELEALRAGYAGLFSDVQALLGNTDVLNRVLAVLPSLIALLEGRQPPFIDKLRRNVALHSKAIGLDLSCASASQLKTAQKGPRLDSFYGQASHGSVLRAEAPPFSPGIGSWVPLPDVPERNSRLGGLQCTCGATAFSDYCGPYAWAPRCTGTPRKPSGAATPQAANQAERVPLRPTATSSGSLAVMSDYVREISVQLALWSPMGPSRQPFLYRRRLLEHANEVETLCQKWTNSNPSQPFVRRRDRLDSRTSILPGRGVVRGLAGVTPPSDDVTCPQQ